MKTYTYNGYTVTEFTADKLRLLWFDKSKNSIPANAFNLGFFGVFKPGNYTLPVGNLCVDAEDIGIQHTADIRSWGGIVSDKVRLNVNQNSSAQFKGRHPTTMFIDKNNKVTFDESSSVSDTCKYAVSGVPVIRNGVDVSYAKFVKPQGWFDDTQRATSRNCIGNKGNVMYLISGATKNTNYISSSELYNALKGLQLDNLIGFDGGGSYISNVGGKTLKTAENRRINTIGVIDG